LKEIKRLYRSKDDKVIAGVCAGLGEYFNIDPVVVRAIFLVSALLGGSGIVIYVVFWIVMPLKPSI
jgi:phage shock protein C